MLSLPTASQSPGLPRVHPGSPSHGLSPFTDLTGKPVCVVRDEFSLAPVPQVTLLSRCLMGMPGISVPIGDPQSNREPQLSSGVYVGSNPSPGAWEGKSS